MIPSAAMEGAGFPAVEEAAVPTPRIEVFNIASPCFNAFLPADFAISIPILFPLFTPFFKIAFPTPVPILIPFLINPLFIDEERTISLRFVSYSHVCRSEIMK
jgi:hypothetical protein